MTGGVTPFIPGEKLIPSRGPDVAFFTLYEYDTSDDLFPIGSRSMANRRRFHLQTAIAVFTTPVPHRAAV